MVGWGGRVLAHRLLFPLLLIACLAGCGPSSEQRAAMAANPAAYQRVMAILSEAGNTPAAGDDLTMYIGDTFSETERQLLLTHVEFGEAAPTF